MLEAGGWELNGSVVRMEVYGSRRMGVEWECCEDGGVWKQEDGS